MRSFWHALVALLSHWRRHPVQFAGIAAGLWLATALWTGVQALNAQARADYARASAVLEAPTAAQLVPLHGDTLRQEVFVALRRAGWRVSPVLEGRVELALEGNVSVQILGIEPLSLPPETRVAGQGFVDFDLAAFTGRPGQAWAAPDTLQRLRVAPGERVSTIHGRQLPPLLVREELAPGVIILDIGHAQELLQRRGAVSRLLLAEHQASRALPAELQTVLRLETPDDADDLERLTDSFHLNLTALGLLAFIVGLFIVHASIGLAFEQRRSTMRVLRACGVSLRTLVFSLTVELGVLAVVGGVLGAASGYALAAALLPDVAASLRSLYGAEVAGTLRLSPSWWAAGIGMSLAGVLLAGVNTLLRARRLPILALGQPQAWLATHVIQLKRQGWAALLLTVVALLAWKLDNSLPSAFLMVAALLLAAALVLPVLLDALLAGAGRWVSRPLAQWFVADSRQQLPALSLALMALLLALGASVGVGSMTEGFRRTFTGWLDQRLAADLYVTPANTQEGLDIQAWLQQHPLVEAIEAQWRVEARLPAGPVLMQGVDAHSRLPQHWPLLEALPNAWQRLVEMPAVMLSEQLARRLDITLGDIVQLSVGGRTHELQAVAIYADYGNPRGHMLVETNWLRRHFTEARLAGLALYLSPEGYADLRHQLQKRFGLDSTRVVQQATIRKWSLEVFERTFAATGALNVLTLGVAGIALLISLLTLGTQRLTQLAPLWALGVERRRLMWLSCAQTMLLASLTVILAMPLGILLSWCLVAVINVYAFGWRLPLYVFPHQLVLLGVIGLFVSAAAMALPLIRLAGSRPAELLRQFSRDV